MPDPTENRTSTVVVIDDVPELRDLLRLVLRRSRFRVIAEGGTGHAAIELARLHRPDVMLLDLSMPEMDGLEALPRVLEASPATRVVVLSGHARERMEPPALQAGARRYLEKGLHPDEILAALEDVVSGAPGTLAAADAVLDTRVLDPTA